MVGEINSLTIFFDGIIEQWVEPYSSIHLATLGTQGKRFHGPFMASDFELLREIVSNPYGL
jgi:hypothetical protein